MVSGIADGMIATLFLSPVSRINHYVLLLFPYAASWCYVGTRRSGGMAIVLRRHLGVAVETPNGARRA